MKFVNVVDLSVGAVKLYPWSCIILMVIIGIIDWRTYFFFVQIAML